MIFILDLPFKVLVMLYVNEDQNKNCIYFYGYYSFVEIKNSIKKSNF